MIVAIDVETTKKPNFLPWQHNAYIVSVSVWSDGEPRSWLLNHPEATQSIRDSVTEIQAVLDEARWVIAHNLKFDLHWLRSMGLVIKSEQMFDTMVAEYTLAGHQPEGLSLNALAIKYELGTKDGRVSKLWDEGYETDQIPSCILNEYCEHDCYLAYEIALQQMAELRRMGMSNLFRLEMAALDCFQEMEENGMLLDVDLLTKYNEEYTQKLTQMDATLAQLLSIDNISSSDQLSAGLYGGVVVSDGYETVTRELKSGEIKEYSRKCKIKTSLKGAGFKPIKGSELKKFGYYSTGIDYLKQLRATTPEQKQIKELLLERSRLDQLNKTYFKGLLERVFPDGRVHPTVNQTITVTSRQSCSNPNLQNQPRGNTGPVKECFITRFN